MPETVVDVIVVGQGLAGTLLAWELIGQGYRVRIIDPDQPISASKIAAGLITPITGRRFVLSWRYDQFWQAARSTYHRLEQELGSEFFRELPHVRIFNTAEELATFEQRRREHPETQDYLAAGGVSDTSRPQSTHVDLGAGCFVMPHGGRLNVPTLLRESRDRWLQSGLMVIDNLDPSELQVSQASVTIPRLRLVASKLIFCRGADDRTNPWFSGVRFLPAKGEVLTIRTAVELDAVVHRGIWLTRSDGDCYQVGSTYDSTNLNQLPTDEGRAQIEKQLKNVLVPDYSVVEHQAAVRPATVDQRPVLGWHDEYPCLGIFNGLGSKGSLQGPWLARHFARNLCEGIALDITVDWKRMCET